MKLSTNFHRFYANYDLKTIIDILAEAGFEGIDFGTDFEEYHTDAHSPAFYQEIKEYAADRGIGFYQTHAPFLTGYADAETRLGHIPAIVKAMEHSALLGSQMIVVHPCKLKNPEGVLDPDFLMDFNLDYFKRLIPYGEEYGIKIAIENIHGHITQTPEGLLRLVDALDHDVFTICYDVGHDYIVSKNPSDMIRKLGARIGCTHVHDNDGKNDLHTLPYYGGIDWEETMKAFAESGYSGNLNYEAARFISRVPADFLLEGGKYMAAVGRYLIGRYEHYKSQP